MISRACIILLAFGGLVTCQIQEFQSEFESDGICDQSLSHLSFNHFNDCEDALNKGFLKSGVYRIQPKTSLRPFKVWCDMKSDGGGWTLIQTRFDGLVDFYRTWNEYRNGFGNVDSEHWLGNNFIRHITQDNEYELKIELTGFQENEFASARYSPFRIGSEDEKYKLSVGKFTPQGGITTDPLSIRNGFMFTTKDNDNDTYFKNCADLAKAGWWYASCYSCNLNGVWMTKERSLTTRGLQSNENIEGIVWRHAFETDFYSLKSVEMKVRKMRNV